MRVLLIDAGNTRIKWGVADAAGGISATGAVPTDDPSALTSALAALAPVDAAIYVSVSGEAVNQQIEQALQVLAVSRVQRFLSLPAVGVLRNDYARPGQLGADRLAAALGAWTRVGAGCLVVNCGTATTIDVVLPLTAEAGRSGPPSTDLQKNLPNATAGLSARFAGGVILPGLSLMKSALHRNTARLPDAAGQCVALPDNTDDAIETGCQLAQLGAIEAMHRQLPTGSPLVLAGGAAAALLPLLIGRGLPVIDAPTLVLEGLAVAILHRFPQ